MPAKSGIPHTDDRGQFFTTEVNLLVAQVMLSLIKPLSGHPVHGVMVMVMVTLRTVTMDKQDTTLADTRCPRIKLKIRPVNVRASNRDVEYMYMYSMYLVFPATPSHSHLYRGQRLWCYSVWGLVIPVLADGWGQM